MSHHEEVTLEIAAIVRQCEMAVRAKIAARQEGMAWRGIDNPALSGDAI